MEALQSEEVSRSQLVHATADSKTKEVRTFQGFLVNCYEPVQATLNGVNVVIDPPAGIFQFISAFEGFVPHPDITIVGVENAENFCRVESQRHLFKDIQPLFVSRYPQSQSKDLIRWLQTIPNRYLHFGDFDFAGIGIYIHEYKRYLGERAIWFVPTDLENMLKKWGSRKLYDVQKINLSISQIEEPGILLTLRLLHQYKRGLEQEALILENKY
ncbi:DUF7281 domain-containing protein [Pontibacter qinzhouensis]|nr:hypothetical protein [Pontibacter qinzhouensis]